MTATNHVLAGALLGTYLPLPVAIPAALASHFVMDFLPHFGSPAHERNNSRFYREIIAADTLISLTFGFCALLLNQWVLFICGAIAYSPDVALVRYYISRGGNLNIQATDRFTAWHLKIQHEYPWGLIVELPLIVVMLPLFITQLLNKL